MAQSKVWKWLSRPFPFLTWIPELTLASLRDDLIAGITVAMVLIPQSMAYAQLAGLPAYYGLYASFLPPMLAALFGSSRQLQTGPVAVVSLMTAATLEPLATAGSEAYCAYALLLALIVGLFQLSLGLLRLGVIVNFISHPVVNGFTNAAAIIIATSQLSKIFGVYVDKGEHHYETIYRVVRAALGYTHWPTLGFAVAAFAIMYGLRRLSPRIPNVLVAVVLTTVISWFFGLQRDTTCRLDAIKDGEVIATIQAFNTNEEQLAKALETRTALSPRVAVAEQAHGRSSIDAEKLRQMIIILGMTIEQHKETSRHLRQQLRGYHLEAVDDGARTSFFLRGKVPASSRGDGRRWRLHVSNQKIDPEQIRLSAGGAVVGTVPGGLPGLRVPPLDPTLFLRLISMAMIISLLGFMEAISIAKAMAAKTGQRLDPNQELIGQGVANIAGAFGQSYPVSGSFSRSAVNLQAGAVSGLSSVMTSAIVVVSLLFLTPLLFHLPQAVLAAIIMMAVIGLVNVSGFIHAWRAQRYDGIISVISFVCTLAFAPHLDRGILIGVLLSIGLYLGRNMKPSIALLSKHDDGSFRNSDRFNLEQCRHISLIRFNGSLFFANAGYLEDHVLERIRTTPELKHIVIVGNGINELDASGEEMLNMLVDRLHSQGLGISVTGLNDHVLDVLRRTGLYDKIGEENYYRSVERALASIHATTHRGSSEERCPLQTVVTRS